MTAFVCDASVLFKLLVAEAHSERAFRLAAEHQLIVPQFALLEIGNALWRRVRAGSSDIRQAMRLLGELSDYDLDVRALDEFVPGALSYAVSLGHPIYDCLYLAMADALGIALVTADERFLTVLRRSSFAPVEVLALADLT